MRKIMVCWDGSRSAARAFERAAEIAARFGSELLTVSVADVPDYVQTTGEYRGALEDAERFFERNRAALNEAAARYDIAYTPVVVNGHPSQALLEYAEKENVDLMVVGRKGHSALERFMVGSVTRRVAIYAPCPVLVVPGVYSSERS